MISNIHTHSIYCDGRDTPEAMVQTALAKGLTALGFSGHSYAPFDPSFIGMSPEATADYRKEVLHLKEKYADQIRIYLGLEQDLFSEEDGLDWEYKIGSVHYLRHGDAYYPIDSKAHILQEMIDTWFDGHVLPMVEEYCADILYMYDTRKPDVIGHFDLYKKFNDKLHYLDENDRRYQSIVQDTLHTLVHKGALLEVNLGGMAKEYTHEPYPSAALLSFLQKEKARLIITTDCHHAPLLDYHYNETVQLLKQLKFPSMVVMGQNGFEEVPLA